jgi:hypothetical protein
MNQVQRKFLIDKIKERTKITVDAMSRETREDMPPSLTTYLLHAVMSNNFELRSTEELKETLRKKALTVKMGDTNWLGKSSWHTISDDEVLLKAHDFFVIPEEYKKMWNEWREKKNELEEKIRQIQLQSDTLITRIQLASDKVLEKMISEVDDMGDISLMDTKLKMIGGSSTDKLLN